MPRSSEVTCHPRPAVTSRIIPPKTTPWNGRPPTSRGGRPARAGRTWPAAAAGSVPPPSRRAVRRSCSTWNSSQASPGSRISARSRSSCPPRAPRPARSPGPPRRRGRAATAGRAAGPPADQPVQPAADLPRQREGVPAGVAADALDHPPQPSGGAVRRPVALVDVEAAARPVGVGRQRVRRRARHRRRRPPGRHRGVLDPLQRQPDRLVEAEQPLRAGRARTRRCRARGRRPCCAATPPAAARCRAAPA